MYLRHRLWVAILSCLLGACATFSNGSSDVNEGTGNDLDCCGSVLGGMCDDGSSGTPCCGVGTCNIFCCACQGGCRRKPSQALPSPMPPAASSTPLNQWPMVMTHDAGTSYYASQTCKWTKAVTDYVMTQAPGTFSQQLDCGARAFDLRPHQDGNDLVMHHGPMVIHYAISDVLKDVIHWASRNTDELVLLYGSHCSGGDACHQMFSDALKAAQIQLIECSDIAKLTLGSALQRGKLSTGGAVLATWGCVEENYDPKITCYGELGEEELAKLKDSVPESSRYNALPNASQGIENYHPEISWSCYGSDASKAFDPFWVYMSQTCDGRGRNQANLWMAQAHWQYDASSIAQGEFLRSCILSDESKSGVNEKLVQKIRQGAFPHINLLEVDNVCDGHGLELLDALRSRFANDIEKPVGKTVDELLV